MTKDKAHKLIGRLNDAMTTLDGLPKPKGMGHGLTSKDRARAKEILYREIRRIEYNLEKGLCK